MGRPRIRNHLKASPVSITLPKPIKDRIRVLASEEGISIASWMRRLALRAVNMTIAA